MNSSDPTVGRRSLRLDLAAIGAIVAVVGLLYHRALGMWWAADDPMALWHAATLTPTAYFVDPTVWKGINPANLHPWMILGCDLDLGLFGLDPTAFHLHQLVAVTAALVAFWLCLRLYLTPVAAAAGALVLAVAPATAEIASTVTTRHYADGLTLACLSLVFFVGSLRRSSLGLGVAAAACFGLALTAKEIFAPLPIVLALLPEGGPAIRLRRLFPFVLVGAGYTVWRWWLLGSVVGGYRPRLVPTGPETAAALTAMAVDARLPFVGFALISAVVLVAAIAALRRCSSRWRWFWIGFSASVALPVIPVLHVYSPRHGFAVAVLAAAAVATGIDRGIGANIGNVGRWLMLGVAVVLLTTAGIGARAQLPRSDELRRVRVEGLEVLRGVDADRAVVSPWMPYWHFFGLMQLRDEVLGLPPGPGVVTYGCLASRIGGCGPTGVLRTVTFDPATGSLVAAVEPTGSCRPVDDPELTVEIRYESKSNLTSWRFGPDHDGRYMVLWAIAPNSLVGIEVPSVGRQRGNIAFEMGVPIVVACAHADGRLAATPPMSGERRGGEITIELPRRD